MIPDAAVDAALFALFPDEPDIKAFKSVFWLPAINTILEAAAPHMLSHERQQTADAHRDAIVNRDTVDRLERELVSAKAEAWDEGSQARWDYQWRDDIEPLTNPYRSQA